jgi:hypothetical protein
MTLAGSRPGFNHPGAAWLRTDVTSKMPAITATMMNAASGPLRSAPTNVPPSGPSDGAGTVSLASAPEREGLVTEMTRK